MKLIYYKTIVFTVDTRFTTYYKDAAFIRGFPSMTFVRISTVSYERSN